MPDDAGFRLDATRAKAKVRAMAQTLGRRGLMTAGGAVALVLLAIWGGNWFFLTDAGALPLNLAGVQDLTAYALAVRSALRKHRVTGSGGAEIDHIELMGPAQTHGNSGRNFVLCPGGAYDRSPCGTGTSAKLACLAADGKLAEGERWLQESVVGSVFEGRYRLEGDQLLPSIRGQAHVVAETTLLLDRRDPFCWGLE